MYYSLKGYIYFNNPQQVLDAASNYTTLRLRAYLDGNKVQFEATVPDTQVQNNFFTRVKNFIDQNGGYVIFSECIQNPDNSIGPCTMTERYFNDPTVKVPPGKVNNSNIDK